MEKKLFRNEHDKMIAGVASGLAAYMQVDVTIIRLLFVISVPFLAGAGLIAYVVMWIIVPVNNDPAARFSKFNEYFQNNNFNTPPFESGQSNPNWTQPVNDSATKTPFETQPNFNLKKPNDAGKTTIGLLLVVIGCFLLMKQLDFIPDWFRFRNFWPVIFIALGISVIAKSKRKNEWKEWHNLHDNTPPTTETFNQPTTMDENANEKDSNLNNPQA